MTRGEFRRRQRFAVSIAVMTEVKQPVRNVALEALAADSAGKQGDNARLNVLTNARRLESRYFAPAVTADVAFLPTPPLELARQPGD